jgi:hypothetical protein
VTDVRPVASTGASGGTHDAPTTAVSMRGVVKRFGDVVYMAQRMTGGTPLATGGRQ